MGKVFVDVYLVFKVVFDEVDDVLGESFLNLIWDGDIELLILI